MVGGVFLFLESDNSGSAGDSMIFSMTTDKGGAEVTLPRRFYRYSSQSFLDPTDIALQLAPDWVARGQRLAAMQSPFLMISLSIQIIPQSARSELVLEALYNQIEHACLHCHRMSNFPNQTLGFLYP